VKLEWFGTYNEEPWVGLKDKVIISWDTAMSGSELSSYSACVVGIVQGESVYIVEVFRDRLQFPACGRSWKFILSGEVKPETALCSSRIRGRACRSFSSYDGMAAIAIQPDGDKIMRLNRNTPRLEAGMDTCHSGHRGSRTSS
jgi:phage terminase large subunit-like protein